MLFFLHTYKKTLVLFFLWINCKREDHNDAAMENIYASGFDRSYRRYCKMQLLLQIILYCFLFILIVKCVVKDSGLNCLYSNSGNFYLESGK